MSNANGTSVRVRTGTEGPRHDPYHYDEITVYRLGHEYMLHTGLAMWLEVDGDKEEQEEYDEKLLVEKFTELTGANPGRWLAWAHRRQSKCPECGCRKLRDAEGYAGESFEICIKCGTVVNSHFNESYVL